MTKRFGWTMSMVFVLVLSGLLANQLFSAVRLVVVYERNLYTIDERGGHYRPLTETAQNPKWEPRFSPDGKLVAFFMDISGEKKLWILDYFTNDMWPLASDTIGWTPYGDGGPAWTSDGAWVYFGISRSAGDCEVGRIRLDGTGFEPLTDIAGYNTQSFDLSPVSGLSTFVRGTEGNGWSNILFLDNLNFNNPDPIQEQYAPHRPVFSPDGQTIAYSNGNSTTTYLINIDKTGQRLVLDNAYPVCWHPDGTRLLVCRGGALYWIDLNSQILTYVADGWWATARNVQLFKANAGENLVITSDARPVTVLQGSAILNSGYQTTLNYRWKEGDNPLCDWTPVDSDSNCPLDLALIPLPIGTHTLTLEVSDGDGEEIVYDEMILTIENSAPHAAASGGGVLELPATATLGGDVSDYDGDILIYRWIEDGVLLYEGTVQSISAGQPVKLPDFVYSISTLGDHLLRLEVSDSINPPVTSEVKIKVIDSTAPSISPVASSTILWPPNHQFVDIVVKANAADNSGQIRLAASISSNEPEDGTGDGDMSPDWTPPIIDQQSGTIRFQLRSERAGSGSGRKYTILISATDSSNNTSFASLEIIVPHDKKR